MTSEEAIELLVNATYSDEWQGNEQLTKANLMAIEALKQEPVKHGEWKYYYFSDINNPYVGWYECTVCKHHEYSEREYCPNCGADMRRETE